MIARMTVSVKLNETIAEQFSIVIQEDNTGLDDFKWTVQDSFGVSFISNINSLFKKIEDKVKANTLVAAAKERVKVELPAPVSIELPKQEQNDETDQPTAQPGSNS